MHWHTLLSSLLGVCAATAAQASPLVPFKFDPLTLGSISPNGWLRTELETSAAGLGGHLYGFYPYIAQSSWIGGEYEYSSLNEALPYWVNAMVPLAYTLQDERLKEDVHTVVDSIISRIQPDGWIGPETLDGGMRMIWARTLLFLGWTNLVDANSTYQQPILEAMYRYNTLMNSMLKNNGTGMIWHEGDKLDPSDYVWFISRVEDMIVSLQWLLDHHPGNQTQTLQENINMIHHYGSKWEAWYVDGTYITEDLYDLPESVTNEMWPFLHGVTIAEGLKYAAVIRRSTHNDSLLTTAKNGVDWTFKYHGAASGTILADERIDGLNPYYGSELCTDVETMYSLAFNYFAIGDADYADRAERAAFNALPAAVSGDWWSHQYMTQPNQPYSKNLSATPFFDDNTQSQTYGLNPDYPCCTVNHPQGYPKFTMYSWVRNGSSGLVHALLSPGKVQTQVAGGNTSIDCETDYPFGEQLSYSISSDKAFDFYVRMPGWASGSHIAASNSAVVPSASAVDAYSRLQRVRVQPGNTSVTYTLDAPQPRTEARANDTVAVYRGALLYAIYIPGIVSEGPPKNWSTQQPLPPGSYPAQAHDHQMLNATEWNIAMDPSTLVFHAGNASAGLPQPTFDDGKLPMYMTAKACLIDWPMFKGAVPGSPIPKSQRKCLGDTFETTLRPYGSAKLHMAEIPTINL